MFPSRRRHPLTTFRFWFFVIGSAAVTVAWRFDMLPVRIGRPETGRRAEESFTEVVLTEPRGEWEQPVRQGGDDPRTLSNKPLFGGSDSTAMVAAPLVSNDRHPTADAHPLRSAAAQFSRPRESQPSERLVQQSADLAVEEFQGEDQPGSGIVQTAMISASSTPREEEVKQADRSIVVPAIDFAEIDRLSQSNDTADHVEAHRKLSGLYWEQPESRDALRGRIDLLAQRIYFQQQPHYMPAHQVQPGDMLQSIGKQYNVSWQYLSKLNRVDPQRIQAGQRLKVIKGPFSAVIDLSDYELTIHAYGYYVTRYPVGIGKDGSTPIGVFKVLNKQMDPTYYGPDEVIDHDDPANPLGERWIDLGDSYGIHGTIDPQSIGRSESRGCIRMLNEDVAAVFDLLVVGSEVTIRE